jgi:hypothetical protein
MSLDGSSQLGPVSLSDTVNLIVAGSNISQLLALDDLWSGYLGAQTTLTPSALGGLLRLVDELDRGISLSAEAASSVWDALNRQSEESITSALSIVLVGRGGMSVFDGLLESEDEDDSIRQLLMSACEFIQREVEVERSILTVKSEQLRKGNLPDPDLRPLFRCILSLVGIAAGASLAAAGTVGTLGVLPAAGLGLLAMVGSSVLSWEQSGCSRVQITSILH